MPNNGQELSVTSADSEEALEAWKVATTGVRVQVRNIPCYTQSMPSKPLIGVTRNPLLIPELFQCILDGLHIPKRDLVVTSPPGTRPADLQEAQRTLAALAQTCRALSEPSLDLLWRRLDSLDPLIRCFSPAVDVYRASVPPSPAEWKIITRYSHRIRELGLHSYFDHLFLGSILACSQAPVLFPSMRVLRWTVPTTDSDLAVIMRRLLSPTLDTLLVIVARTHGIESFLQNYISLSPQLNRLKSVKFEIYQASSDGGKISISEIHQFSQAICTHEHLESLEVSVPVDDIALRHVVLSPQLKVASLVLHPVESNLGNVHINAADIPFRNVKKLELHAWDLHFVFSLLRPTDQIFHTFRLRLIGLHGAQIISAFLTTLASPQRMDSLQSISLTWGNIYAILHEPTDVSHEYAVHCLTYDTLRPLTSFKRLRKLVLGLFNQIHLSDEGLADLARSWPMLEVLELNSNNGSHITSITLEGLLSLLTLCPQLRRLTLSVDAREVPEKMNVDVCNPSLMFLWLPDSPIRDARLVANFFSRYLPSLTSVHVRFIVIPSLPDQPLEEYDLLWRKVNEYLQRN